MLCAPSGAGSKTGTLLCVANDAVASQRKGCPIPLHCPPLQQDPAWVWSPSRLYVRKQGRTAEYLLLVHCGHSPATCFPVALTQPRQMFSCSPHTALWGRIVTPILQVWKQSGTVRKWGSTWKPRAFPSGLSIARIRQGFSSKQVSEL